MSRLSQHTLSNVNLFNFLASLYFLQAWLKWHTVITLRQLMEARERATVEDWETHPHVGVNSKAKVHLLVGDRVHRRHDRVDFVLVDVAEARELGDALC